jgi:Sulfotransferase family
MLTEEVVTDGLHAGTHAHRDAGRAGTRPVLIAGAPRTGTTWVGQALSFAQDSCFVNEPDNENEDPFALKAKLPLGRFPVLAPGDAAPPAYERLWDGAFAGAGHARTPRWVAAKLLLKRVNRLELWNALCTNGGPRLTPRLRVLAAIAPPRSGQRHAPNVVVKSVHGPFALEWIAERARPQVVVILRHPLNVIASWTELRWGGCSLATHPLLRARFVDRWRIPALSSSSSRLAKVTWEVGLLMSALEASAQAHPDWHVVWHEALCRDPHTEFKRLYAELGLGWTAAADAYLTDSNRPGSGAMPQRIASEQPERWRKRLSADQVREIRSVLERFPLSVRGGDLTDGR